MAHLIIPAFLQNPSPKSIYSKPSILGSIYCHPCAGHRRLGWVPRNHCYPLALERPLLFFFEPLCLVRVGSHEQKGVVKRK